MNQKDRKIEIILYSMQVKGLFDCLSLLHFFFHLVYSLYLIYSIVVQTNLILRSYFFNSNLIQRSIPCVESHQLNVKDWVSTKVRKKFSQPPKNPNILGVGALRFLFLLNFKVSLWFLAYSKSRWWRFPSKFYYYVNIRKSVCFAKN